MKDCIHFQKVKAVPSLKLQWEFHFHKACQKLDIRWSLPFLSSCCTSAILAILHVSGEGRIWAKAEGAHPAGGGSHVSCGAFSNCHAPTWDIDAFPRGHCPPHPIKSLPSWGLVTVLDKNISYSWVCWGRKELKAVSLSPSLSGFPSVDIWIGNYFSFSHMFRSRLCNKTVKYLRAQTP